MNAGILTARPSAQPAIGLVWREPVLRGIRLSRVVEVDGDPPPASRDGRRAGLVRRAVGGDEEAFEALISGFGQRLLATARKILRDPDAAEDAVQQAVILAWRLLPRLRDPDKFEGWLYKVLVSACYGEARRARRFSGRIQMLSIDRAAEDDVDRWLEHDALERAFQALTPAHRAVVVLHHYVGFPLTEVASIVGVSPGTARSRLHYALRSLRAALQAADRPAVSDLQR